MHCPADASVQNVQTRCMLGQTQHGMILRVVLVLEHDKFEAFFKRHAEVVAEAEQCTATVVVEKAKAWSLNSPSPYYLAAFGLPFQTTLISKVTIQRHREMARILRKKLEHSHLVNHAMYGSGRLARASKFTRE